MFITTKTSLAKHWLKRSDWWNYFGIDLLRILGVSVSIIMEYIPYPRKRIWDISNKFDIGNKRSSGKFALDNASSVISATFLEESRTAQVNF